MPRNTIIIYAIDLRHVHYLCFSLCLVEGTHREHVQLVEVESEQTSLISRSLIPVPLLICIAFYAVLFKRTSYLEGGHVIIC